MFIKKDEIRENYIDCHKIFEEMFANLFENVTYNTFSVNKESRKVIVEYEIIPKKQGIYNLNLKYNDNSEQSSADVLDYINGKIIKGSHRKDYNIIALKDAVSEYYCNKISPEMAKYERLLRELIFTVMVKALGNEWSSETIPQNIIKEIKQRRITNNEILERGLCEMTLKQIENYLFKPFSKNNTTDRKRYKPIIIWEKYFVKDGVELENIKEVLSKIRQYRNRIAHNKEFYKKDYLDCKKIVDKFNADLEEAIEMALDITVTGSPIIGNSFAELNDNIYYWENNKESFSDNGLWGMYNLTPNNKKKLICINRDDRKELIEEPAVNDLYVLNNRIFYETKECIEDKEIHNIYSVNLEGKDKKEHAKGKKILNVIKEYGYMILSDKEFLSDKESLYIFDSNTMTSKFLCECNSYSNKSGFLGMDQSFIYYMEEHENGAVSLCKINLDGSEKKVLKEFNKEYEYRLTIPCFEIIDDKLCFTLGGYAGSGHFYQPDGKLVSIDKEGDNYKIIAKDVGEYFSISRNNKDTYAHISNSCEEIKNIRINLENNEVEEDNTIVYANGEPFVFEDRVMIYEEDSEKPKVLLDRIEYKQIMQLKKAEKNIDLYRLTYIQKVNKRIFYVIETSKYTPEKNIGWRDAYSRIKTFIYFYNENNEQTKLLYEY